MNNENNDARPDGTPNPEKRFCGVTEEGFPQNNICCKCSDYGQKQEYTKICSNFKSWVSLPDSESLKVTAILECSLYGYGKRINK
ncbi:MAG: hypothetical protein VB078_04655 [Clostridiaceae bacterium]|nr:hypothetical protein [Clostridiaceae bacterium]